MFISPPPRRLLSFPADALTIPARSHASLADLHCHLCLLWSTDPLTVIRSHILFYCTVISLFHVSSLIQNGNNPKEQPSLVSLCNPYSDNRLPCCCHPRSSNSILELSSVLVPCSSSLLTIIHSTRAWSFFPSYFIPNQTQMKSRHFLSISQPTAYVHQQAAWYPPPQGW